MFFYLKGGLKFWYKDYKSAKSLFEKAAQYSDWYENVLFYQYYGQTLLYLNNIDESFIWLSKAYKKLEHEGWDASNDEEKRLTKGTFESLKYLSENYSLNIDGFEYGKK